MIVIVSFLIITLWIKSLFYIMENRDEIVFKYLLYDHIEYNGNAYYMAENQQDVYKRQLSKRTEI